MYIKRGVRRLMEKSILNFHFDYVNTSLKLSLMFEITNGLREAVDFICNRGTTILYKKNLVIWGMSPPPWIKVLRQQKKRLKKG